MAIQTELEFTLPKGYMDENGKIHKKGVMRMATAVDEILPLKDPRVQSNPAYVTILILSRVILSIGEIDNISTNIIEKLFTADLSYLQSLYQSFNNIGTAKVTAVCPKCKNEFEVELNNFFED